MIGKGALDAFVAEANEVIEFQMIRNAAEIDEASKSSCPPFNPEFTHQLFGESEAIFGYRNLKIRILYTASSLYSYINMKYAEKVPHHSKIFSVTHESYLIRLILICDRLIRKMPRALKPMIL